VEVASTDYKPQDIATMSDQEEVANSSGYSTPVPELDDHRNQTASAHRPADRPRRGTFDSLYGARVMAPGGASGEPRVRDFEEAVVDEDAGEQSPSMRRTRRPTIESVSERSSSPPNSVKAFAEARRRERGLSVSDPKLERKPDELELQRTASGASRNSYRSRQQTVATAADTASLATNKSAEEDVCFPLQDEQRGDHLYIDFDYLESFIQTENEAREAARRPSAVRLFPDLRPESTETAAPPPTLTIDGDFLGTPFGSESRTEKAERSDTEEPAKAVQPPPPVDHSRVSFFSSAWESTIHAADLEGLILPGEDIRGLFTFPRGETDGVWWLNINKPSEEEVRAICRAFGVHPLTVEDVTTQESREKIELFPSYYFACFRSFGIERDEETGENEFVPFNIYVVVFREGTLSFSYSSNPHASHVRKRIAMLKDYVALSSDWICYALM
jgi:magnesium transporter